MVDEVRDIELLPKQIEFIERSQQVKHCAYIGGFGSGKTHVLAIRSLIEAQTPSYGLIGASTYRLLKDTTQRKFMMLCPPEWIRKESKSENKVILINGSEIIFRALDSSEKLTNLDIDWFAIDELGEVPETTWKMLQGRIRKPGGSHKGFGVGNPAGPTHWSYNYFVLKAQQYPGSYGLVQATTYENTFIDPDYALELERSYDKGSLYYRRFVLGEFVAFEGAYWPHFDIRPFPTGHMIDDATFKRILRRQMVIRRDGTLGYMLDATAPYTVGKVIDFGFEHPFVCLWYITDGNNIIFYDEYYRRHGLIQEHCKEIRKHEHRHVAEYNLVVPPYAYTDHDAVSRHEISNCKDLETGEYIGFECTPADKVVMESILLVQTLINTDTLYVHENCTNTRIEIPSYRAKSLEKSIKEDPIKENDDTCDCIKMACYMLLRHKMPHWRPKSATYTFSEEKVVTTGDFLDNIHQMAFKDY